MRAEKDFAISGHLLTNIEALSVMSSVCAHEGMDRRWRREGKQVRTDNGMERTDNGMERTDKGMDP